MIKLDITVDQIKRANALYEFEALNGSITKGKSNIYGAIGEIVVKDYYADILDSDESTYDYDLILKGYKIDVKTKKNNC